MTTHQNHNAIHALIQNKTIPIVVLRKTNIITTNKAYQDKYQQKTPYQILPEHALIQVIDELTSTHPNTKTIITTHNTQIIITYSQPYHFMTIKTTQKHQITQQTQNTLPYTTTGLLKQNTITFIQEQTIKHITITPEQIIKHQNLIIHTQQPYLITDIQNTLPGTTIQPCTITPLTPQTHEHLIKHLNGITQAKKERNTINKRQITTQNTLNKVFDDYALPYIILNNKYKTIIHITAKAQEILKTHQLSPQTLIESLQHYVKHSINPKKTTQQTIQTPIQTTLELWITPIQNEYNQPETYCIGIKDTTQENEQLIQIQAQKALLQLIIDELNTIIAVIKGKNVYLASKQGAKLLIKNSETFTKHNTNYNAYLTQYKITYHDNTPIPMHELLTEKAQQGIAIKNRHMKFITKNTQIPAIASNTLIKNKNDDIIGAIQYTRLTGQQEYEQKQELNFWKEIYEQILTILNETPTTHDLKTTQQHITRLKARIHKYNDFLQQKQQYEQQQIQTLQNQIKEHYQTINAEIHDLKAPIRALRNLIEITQHEKNNPTITTTQHHVTQLHQLIENLIPTIKLLFLPQLNEKRLLHQEIQDICQYLNLNTNCEIQGFTIIHKKLDYRVFTTITQTILKTITTPHTKTRIRCLRQNYITITTINPDTPHLQDKPSTTQLENILRLIRIIGTAFNYNITYYINQQQDVHIEIHLPQITNQEEAL